MERTVWTFHTAGQLHFGRGAADRVGEVAAGFSASRALIVTDPRLQAAGLVGPIQASLEAAGLTVDVFNGGEPEPSFAAALACEAQARKWRPDVLIALGGGSNIDLAKIAAVLIAHGGHPRDYVGDGKVPGPIAPLIALPTTAGTGSEVSGATVLLDSDRKLKVGVLSNHLRPRAAIVDPLLTVSCPPHVTADAGIDALTHAIEAYTAVDNEAFPLPPGEFTIYQGRHPLGMGLAEQAIALVGKWLAPAVSNGGDLAAREGMHLAALLAGMAFSNIGVAAVHALEYPIGGAVHCSHGRGNGLLLPYVMEFNKPARLEAFARIAALLGEDVSRLSVEEAAEAAIGRVRRLRLEVGIPDRLRELGVKPEMLRGLAETAAGITRILRVNPRPVTADSLEGILRAAY